jgi:hypothetical protein
MDSNPERERIAARDSHEEQWSLWGPYLSDRQWGTVREDYSADGDAWNYFPFEHARSRAYRWGEDGIFGICDDRQRLCFAPAFWNGADPFLKERLFGLSGPQGNHGENVKEQYYYLDNLPSHAYMRALYKYPQARFPYEELLRVNAARTRDEPEYELIDTGAFAGDAYFDVTVEYAKAAPGDVLIALTAINRGSESAVLHLIPQLWFRNEWSWSAGIEKPEIVPAGGPERNALVARHASLGTYTLYYEAGAEALFTENESNLARLYGAQNAQPYVKDGIDDALTAGRREAVNPAQTGTKAGLHYVLALGAAEQRTVRLRLTDRELAAPFDDSFAATLELRAREADRFYAALPAGSGESAEAAHVRRAAFAGMLWNKQFYFYVVRDWLLGDPLQPPPPATRRSGRNATWYHLYNDDVLSMPDTWEFPWYAGWDLAFHAVVLAHVDPAAAKRQLLVLTREWYMSPSGQLPAYEWSFDDINPPVHAWGAFRVFEIEREHHGRSDYLFLERVFQKLLMNFTWWVNREDPKGNNVFTGGFLGLDNIGAFNRSEPLPPGWHLLQSDATSWMAVYALDMMRIALVLTEHDPSYEDIASKFFEHFLYIAFAINEGAGNGSGLWDESDGFFYDHLANDGGGTIPVRVRSLVGLLPLLAVETIEPETLERLPNFARRLQWFVDNRPELKRSVSCMEAPGMHGRRVLAILDPDRLRRLLAVALDEAEFLSPYGIRSLSKIHQSRPYVADFGGKELRVDYEPAESRSAVFGGNSNWRGPVWFPLNFLIVEALRTFDDYYGGNARFEFPAGSGRQSTLGEIATALSQRLRALFLRDGAGARPADGPNPLLQNDPHFREHLLFHEYFHGDDGRGLGASHQTGWTGLVAALRAE